MVIPMSGRSKSNAQFGSVAERPFAFPAEMRSFVTGNSPNRTPTMMNIRHILLATSLAIATTFSSGMLSRANAASADELNTDADHALQTLYRSNPVALDLSKKARAVLVFPNIIKAGLVFGAAYGEGELKRGSTIDGYYNSFTGSWGLQAGAQSYGYAVFLMTKQGGKLPPSFRRMGDRRRTDGGRGERGRGQEPVHLDAEGRRVRLHLRPAGADDRHQHRRNEDYQDQALTENDGRPCSLMPGQRGGT